MAAILPRLRVVLVSLARAGVALASVVPCAAQTTQGPAPGPAQGSWPAAAPRQSMEFEILPTQPRSAEPGGPAAPASPSSAPAMSATPGAPSGAIPSGATAVSAGLLECRGAFATGYGFSSTRKVRCEFRPSHGMVHYYEGTLDRVGLDIGVSDQGSMLWGVLATSRDLAPGALSGRYVGVSSGIAVGPGFSANMLASEDASRQVTLQPVSVSADSGLSLSITGATLTLESVAVRPR